MPKRIQRKRTKGWRMPTNAVYVGRPTMWGNPWWSAEAYREWLTGINSLGDSSMAFAHFEQRLLVAYSLPLLKGKDLCCWCPLDKECHADVLLELANA